MFAAGCARNYRLVPGTPTGDGVAWVGPTPPTDRRTLDRWREAVGPVFIATAPAAVAQPVRQLIVASWNTAVGAGDVMAFLRDLRDRQGSEAAVVLLLQEVYRKGPDVPSVLSGAASFATRLGLEAPGSGREDIAAIAGRSGLHAYYAPSMRNGSPLVSEEDRGNAILSSLPLSDLAGIELPFERQRRVAVAATLTGMSPRGAPWTLRVVSAHLDNMAGFRRAWIFGSQYARMRQGRALVAYLEGSACAVLAGDFNTWSGFSDGAYQETARAFPGTRPTDRRPTFRGGLRLDHMFFRLPDGWTARAERGSSRYGSDHFPLIGTINIGER